MVKLKFKSLKEAREHKDLTQAEVAQAASIHESYYSLIETGNRQNVSIQTAQLICDALGISLDEFFLHTNSTKCKVASS